MALEVQSIIDNCPLFSSVGPEGILRLTSMAQPRQYSRNRIIFHEGEKCAGVFIVVSGLVRIYKLASDGKEYNLHLAKPSKTFAEVAAIGRIPYPANAQALEDTQCVLLPIEPFNHALETDHNLCRQLLGSMAVWTRQMVGKLEDVVMRDATSRLAHYLLETAGNSAQSHVVLPMIKRHVASHLNFTSETLSRTLHRLTDDGLIESTNGPTVRILDAQALRDVAG